LGFDRSKSLHCTAATDGCSSINITASFSQFLSTWVSGSKKARYFPVACFDPVFLPALAPKFLEFGMILSLGSFPNWRLTRSIEPSVEALSTRMTSKLGYSVESTDDKHLTRNSRLLWLSITT